MVESKVRDAVEKELSGTLYACTSLTQLSGGTANFVYRGVLSQPLPDGTTTVIVKHAEDYLASNAGFKLSAKRCLVEESALRALDSMQSVTTTNESPGSGQKYQITVKTPNIYHFSPETYTQVMEDLPSAVDLKTFLRSPGVSDRISKDWSLSIGRTLGAWLRSFHFWIADPKQIDVATQFGEWKVMRDLKFSINYDGLLSRIEAYPDLLEGSREVFEKVRDLAASELEESELEGSAIRPIHGDFWSGNVLIPTTSLSQPLPTTPLLITDWEMSQVAPRSLDLAQMIAELYMLKHFRDIDAGLWIIQGFVEGYQDITEDMAFRILIHVGTHLVFWGSTIPDWGNQEQVREVVRVGRDLITRAWGRDRAWFGSRGEAEVWGVLLRE